MRPRAWFLALSIAGCGPNDAESGSDAGGQPSDDACQCAASSIDACGESLCGAFSAERSFDDDWVVSDEAALDCVLTALRDRTPGVVSWSANENSGQYEEDISVAIASDGTALVTGSGSYDIMECDDLGLRRIEPKAPEWFDACLAEPQAADRFACLAGQADPIAERVITVCREESCSEGV